MNTKLLFDSLEKNIKNAAKLDKAIHKVQKREQKSNPTIKYEMFDKRRIQMVQDDISMLIDKVESFISLVEPSFEDPTIVDKIPKEDSSGGTTNIIDRKKAAPFIRDHVIKLTTEHNLKDTIKEIFTREGRFEKWDSPLRDVSYEHLKKI